MDESKNSISPNKLIPGPASDRKSAAVGAPHADLARSHEPVAPGPQRHTDQINFRRNDLSSGASFVVYCGDEEEIAQGFLIALGAMGVVEFEKPAEPAKAPVAGVKP
jgi:hypothetical protein